MHCWPAAAAAAVWTVSEMYVSVDIFKSRFIKHLLQIVHPWCAHTLRQMMGHRDKRQGAVSGHGVPVCIA